MSKSHQKLSKILRTRPETVLDLESKMDLLTGKSGVIDKIIQENESRVEKVLAELGLTDPLKRNAENVYGALTDRLINADKIIFDFLGKPDLASMAVICGKLCETAFSLAPQKTGFFIKKEKAVQMLEKFSPQNLLDFFGYANVGELIDKQGFASVFSSLRFAQDNEWMHKFFDEAYNDLTPEDFEEREIELKVLETQWLDVADRFLKKKYHNLSHLKELGIIFIVPIKIDMPGETMRMFTLMLHYLNEVPFYSKMFREIAQSDNFVSSLKSLLRGDVPEGALPVAKKDKLNIRIVQRYLAKDDPNDFRLSEPHINPEAEHWYKAEGDLSKLNMIESELISGWQELDFSGNFFLGGLAGENKEELISFDLIDLVMSLVKKGEIKYLYHQQEALWNKIFVEYLGRDKMNELIEENIIKGYIEL